MKYEMIFGDEKLFDGVPEYVEFIRYNSYSRDYLWGDLNVIHHLTFEELKAIPIVAMRRIIKEPKRWTVEDQKAGRLPEVGSEVSFCHFINTTFRQGVVKYIDSKIIVIETSNEIRPFVYEVDLVELKPIETPEEKAQRLRNEWCNEAGGVCSLGVTTLTRIYDAMLSGELPMPVKAVSDEDHR